ncbi:MAG: hypothetical protein K5666_03875 [Bacilli bacterium]|nr:hypothetical protein [Bacilli bacterium]
MKKGLLLLIVILGIIFAPRCFAEEYEYDVVDSYIDGIAYYDGVIVKNCWAYDLNTRNYVKLDENGYEIMRLDDPRKDPTLKHGTIKIKAIVPKNMNDDRISVIFTGSPFHYENMLTKDNNFEITIDAITDLYRVQCVDLDSDAEIQFPTELKVYEGKESVLELDYSKYAIEEKVETKEVFNKKYIIYIVMGVVVLFFLLLLFMFIKAKNM